MSTPGISNRRIAEVPIAVIDFETTGLTPGIDRVLEVSVARLEPGSSPEIVFDTLINPDRPVAATEIHGITDDDVKDAPSFRQVADRFVDSLAGCVVAAYNVYFDIKFLKYELEQVGIKAIPPHLCVMYMRPLLGLGGRCRLDEACQNYGLPFEAAHTASADCHAAAQLMAIYLDEISRQGIQTYRDIAQMKSYKFLSSFGYHPLGGLRGLSASDTPPLKSRSTFARPAAARKAVPSKDNQRAQTNKGLRAYWDTLVAAVADLEMSDDEIDRLSKIRQDFALPEERIRALHAKVYLSVLSRFSEDMILDQKEAAALKRLAQCLAKAGWAPC